MKKFCFRYKRVKSEEFGVVYYPIAKIKVKAIEDWIDIDVVVDSGAVITLFPRTLCSLIGLNFEDGRKTLLRSVAHEELPVRVHRVSMQIGDEAFKADVAFAETDRVPYILGRFNVFDRFEIRFNPERKLTCFISKKEY